MHDYLLLLSRKAEGVARRPARARALAACLLAAALLAAAAGPAPAGAAARAAAFASTLTVTNTNDAGAGSLRQAIADAASGDTINFNLPAGSAIVLTSGELLINKSLNISGPGAASLSVGSNGQFRILRVTSGVTVNISGLTIRDGGSSPGVDPVNGGGAGIHNSGTLTVTGCVVADSTNFGGGTVLSTGVAFSGGGINNLGTLTLVNTTVSNNISRGNVSVMDYRGDAFGGGIHNNAGATLILRDSTVSGNFADMGGGGSSGEQGSAAGGGIYNAGALTMTNSTVSGNSTLGTAFPSEASRGGGVENAGTMTADGCSIVNNVAQSNFDPFSVSPPSQGGGVNNDAPGTLTLTNCDVSGNKVLAGASNPGNPLADGFGGGVNNLSTATLTNTTVSGNLARGGSLYTNAFEGTNGGANGNGGGLYSVGSLTMTNSTVSGNQAEGGLGRSNRGGSPGGKGSGGGILAEGTLTLTNTTVTLNAAAGGRGQSSSAEGGGVLFNGSGEAKLLNTIVAGNDSRGNSVVAGANDATAPDVSGAFDSQGHNLVGRNDGAEASFPAGTPNGSGDLVGTSASPLDAKLGPLADNGGPTRTHRPWAGSPAIEGGDNAVLSPPYSLTTDQRGAGFPRLVDTFVDIGAVEFQGSSPTFAFASAASSVGEGAGGFDVTVTRAGGLDAGDATVDFSATDGTASSRSDFDAVFGTLHFASGETSKTFTVFVTDDAYAEGAETVSLALSNPTGGAALAAPAAATLTIDDNDSAPPATNPIDGSQFFVRQHYVDFLNRAPDAPGLAFWTNEIESCGADAQCREVKRVHVSAAFFLSIEFTETGVFALRARRAAFGSRSSSAASRVTLDEFLRDSRQLGEGVIVGPTTDWQQRLEQNKLDYLARLVETDAFRARYPDTLTPTQYVNALFQTAGVTPTADERNAALAGYGWGGTTGRASALKRVAESASVANAEFDPAFVLSEYFGYLRRNPTDAPDSDDSGYQFWLSKLDQFQGDFVKAEMVKAFISSAEYRRRFGPN